MKGIIYVRVSSQEQVSGTSLEGQREACSRYAEDKGIKIVKIFIEKGESATAANRTELLKALDFCKENKGQINAFIVWKIDRFARNTTDHYGLQAQLMKFGAALHSVSEPMISEGPVGKVLEAVLAGFAQFENDIRKQRCEGGMQRKIAEGIWPWWPPIGYIHSKTRTDRRKTQPDDIDEERFYLIQRGLKEYAQAKHTISTLTEAFNSWGLKTRTGKKFFKQLTEKMLKDRYYAGILVNPWTKEEYVGLHKPMITLDEYCQIQKFKSGASNNAITPRLSDNPDFPLRRFVFCTCGNGLTGSWHLGRKRKHAYYHCYNKECPNYLRHTKKGDLENKFKEFLESVEPQEKYLRLFEKVFIDNWKSQQVVIKQEADSYKRKLRIFEDQKERIFQMRINGEITKEEFLEMKDRLENQVTTTRISSNEAQIESDNIKTMLIYALQYIKKLAIHWQNITEIKQKQQLQKLILPEGITYDRVTKSFGTAVLSSIFKTFEDSSASKSDFVAGGGFAPPISWLCLLL